MELCIYAVCMYMQFTHENEKAQRYLLGAFEKLVGIEFHDQLIGKTATILKAMYDLDLVDEEVFLDWSKKVSFLCFDLPTL